MSAAYPLGLYVIIHFCTQFFFFFWHSLFTIQTLFIVCSLPICPLFFSHSCCNCSPHPCCLFPVCLLYACFSWHLFTVDMFLFIDIRHSVAVYDILVICMLTVGHPFIIHLLFIDSSSVCLLSILYDVCSLFASVSFTVWPFSVHSSLDGHFHLVQLIISRNVYRFIYPSKLWMFLSVRPSSVASSVFLLLLCLSMQMSSSLYES